MIHWVHKQVREFCHHKMKIPSSLTGAAFAPRSLTTGFIMCGVLQLWKTLFYFIFLFFKQLLIFPLPLVSSWTNGSQSTSLQVWAVLLPSSPQLSKSEELLQIEAFIMHFVLAVNSFRGFCSFQVTLTVSSECPFTTHCQENISD